VESESFRVALGFVRQPFLLSYYYLGIESKEALGKPWRRSEDNIKMGLK
jgi:hypothetical protein